MIRVFEPKLNINDKISVLKTMQKNFISGTSPTVQEFENELASKFDRKYCVALSNGSVALDVALQLYDFKKDDEVIVPSFTIISCLSAILRTKATPIFCDVDINSWNMTLENIKKVITKNTKAIILVHLYGLVGEVNEIVDYCNKNNIIIIEDAAESHGQVVGDKRCGSIGDVSTFSFYANKHITTGEGGAVLTDNKQQFLKLKQMVNLDFESSKRFIHNNLYWNYRLGGLQAALGLSQIKNLEKTIIRKIEQGNYYNHLFSDLSNYLQLPLREYKGVKNHYWVYGIMLKKPELKVEFTEYLLNSDIETRPFFYPLHLQPVLPKIYKDLTIKPIVSEKLYESGLYIPIGNHLTQKKQRYISNKIHNFFN